MYTKELKEQQFSFWHNNFFLKPELDKNNIIIKTANTLNWQSLSDKLSRFYCQNNGRPTKPARAKIGLLILKHLYQLSDKEVVDFLKPNFYAQYLCDVSFKEAQSFIDSSTLTYFRKQIGSEGIRLIEEELLNILKSNNRLRGKKLIVDTTVAPSAIAYPTDINLLEKVRVKAIKFLEQAKELGAKTYRTYKRTARKTYLSYQKIRKHSTRQRRKIQRKLIAFAGRNIGQLKQAASILAKNAKSKSAETFTKAKEFLSLADKIIEQQRNVYKGKPVKGRIVSTWAAHVRPMVRGKFPVNVEFGPKVLLNLKNGFLFLAGLYFENVSDTALLIPAINYNQKLLGYIPTQLSTDRGFYSRDNIQYCQDIGIKKIAVEIRGKHLPQEKQPPYLKRLRKCRCAIEAKISLAKRKFGLGRVNYRIKDGEEIWTRLGLIAMNLKLALSSA